MNSKGQMTIAIFVGVFITILVGLILFETIAQEVGSSTNQDPITEYTFTSAANGSSVYITAYKSITPDQITNGTAGIVIGASNYTITNNVIDPTTGSLAVQVATAANAEVGLGGEVWSINGTAQRPDYISSSGARSVAGLITLMFAIAIAIIAMSPVVKSGVLQMMGR